METIEDKVRRSVSRMIRPGDRVLVAVSGGVDSVSLLHLLHDLREEFRFELSLAHLNHMARGKASLEDARFVERLGKELGLTVHVAKINVGEERKNLKTSFQEAGRILRYRFLECTLKSVGGNKLALGHTADDQAETVLMNLLRGTGLKGLAGMSPVRGSIIRPLLECSRAEVEGYLKSRKLEFRSDATNAEKYYLRNRVRHDLIPFLETFNRNMKSNLAETSRIIRDDDECLSEQTDRIFPEIAVSLEERPAVAINIQEFTRQSPAIQKRLVRRAIESLKGELRRISSRHVREIIGLFRDPREGKRICLPDNFTACTRRESIEIKRNRASGESILINRGLAGQTTELKIPGWTDWSGTGLKFQTRLLPFCQLTWPPGISNQAYLDYDKTGQFIQARFFRPGDRFVPLGMKGRKKLKAFFIDEKIPRETRKRIPVLTTRADDIIWVYGRRISESYRVTAETRNVLFIEGVGNCGAVSPE